jgi:hypothetical protein
MAHQQETRQNHNMTVNNKSFENVEKYEYVERNK